MYLDLLKLKRNDVPAAIAYWRKYRARLTGVAARTTYEQLSLLQDDPAAFDAALKALLAEPA
jgi:hypothetical protein